MLYIFFISRMLLSLFFFFFIHFGLLFVPNDMSLYLCFCIKCKMIYVHYSFRKYCRLDARLQLSMPHSISVSCARSLCIADIFGSYIHTFICLTHTRTRAHFFLHLTFSRDISVVCKIYARVHTWRHLHMLLQFFFILSLLFLRLVAISNAHNACITSLSI